MRNTNRMYDSAINHFACTAVDPPRKHPPTHTRSQPTAPTALEKIDDKNTGTKFNLRLLIPIVATWRRRQFVIVLGASHVRAVKVILDRESGLNTECSNSLRNVCTWIDLWPLPIEWKQIDGAERTTNNKRKNKFNKYTCAPSPSSPSFDFRQRHALMVKERTQCVRTTEKFNYVFFSFPFSEFVHLLFWAGIGSSRIDERQA